METHILIQAAKAASLDLRVYSGRGMSGKQCVGIDTDDSAIRLACELIRAARDLTRDESALDELLTAIEGTQTDSMGSGTICYWPSIPAPDDAAA